MLCSFGTAKAGPSAARVRLCLRIDEIGGLRGGPTGGLRGGLRGGLGPTGGLGGGLRGGLGTGGLGGWLRRLT